MERSQVAQERAEEKGISFRESEQMVDSELFLDEYPPVSGAVQNVPPCCRARAERSRKHVPPRPTRQCA